jgi:hypothetical protein
MSAPPRRPWTAEEDAKLAEAYAIAKGAADGAPAWKEVSQILAAQLGCAGRSARQCRDRWATRHEAARPGWTEREDKLVLLAHARFGDRWSLIRRLFAAELNGKNALDIRNRFAHSIRRRVVEHPDGIELRAWARGRPRRKTVLEAVPEALPLIGERQPAAAPNPVVIRLMSPAFKVGMDAPGDPANP